MGSPLVERAIYTPTVEKKMPISHSLRLTLLSVGVLCMFAWLTASASAAGLPEIEGTGQANTNIMNTRVEANVNPEGAATTFKVEYKLAGTSTFVSGPAQSVGSGTAWVPVVSNLSLKPEATYELRISANNSFGTTREVVAKSFATAKWSIESGLDSASFSSTGTWKLQFTAGGIEAKTECTVSGSNGSLGHAQAIGDSYKGSAVNCSHYQNGKFVCKAHWFSFNMDGLFVNQEGVQHFPLCEEGALYSLTFNGPYAVSMPQQTEMLKTQPVTLTAPVTVNSGWNGTITITTNWSLPSGWKFGVAL